MLFLDIFLGNEYALESEFQCHWISKNVLSALIPGNVEGFVLFCFADKPK